MIEKHQFESGVYYNIFQSSKTKSRQIISPSILTYLGNQLGELGISMQVDQAIIKGPTLMETLLDSKLTIEQLRGINYVRLQRKYIYWEPELEGKYQWPRREVSPADEELFDSVIRSFKSSRIRTKRYHFPKSGNRGNRTYSLIFRQQATIRHLSAACDGSLKDHRMG